MTREKHRARLAKPLARGYLLQHRRQEPLAAALLAEVRHEARVRERHLSHRAVDRRLWAQRHQPQKLGVVPHFIRVHRPAENNNNT